MAIKDELQLLFDKYVAAYRLGDAEGCAAIFADNAVLISPYGPSAWGRDGIRETHRHWTTEGGGRKQIEVKEAGVSGDLAWCLAEFSEGEVTGEGTSLNVMERQPDGGWLIRLCSLNDRDPASN